MQLTPKPAARMVGPPMPTYYTQLNVGMIEDNIIVQKYAKPFIDLRPDIKLLNIFGSEDSYLEFSKKKDGTHIDILQLDMRLPSISEFGAISINSENDQYLEIDTPITHVKEDWVFKAIFASVLFNFSKRVRLHHILKKIRSVS